ncbi:MAG: hypothetical protein JXB34_00415 [Bacteroidales bacterium]|nr:hypothetical protein [Bacteroidales bacterium]
MDKKIICITGADGAGKSTVIKTLQEKLAPVYLATIWDLLGLDAGGVLFKSKAEVDQYLCSLTPGSRLLFLAHAMKYATDKAMESKRQIILIDSYYYKYFVSELSLGANKEHTILLQDMFPPAGITIKLELPAKAAAERKQYFSRYECGLEKIPDQQKFIKFQESLPPYWQIFENNNWHKIDAEKPIDMVISEVLNLVNMYL